MAPNLKPWLCVFLLFLLLSFLFFGSSFAELEHEISHKVRTAPHKDVGSNVIDGTGIKKPFKVEDANNVVGNRKLDAQWAGLCNRMVAGVMLPASFDLIQEG